MHFTTLPALAAALLIATTHATTFTKTIGYHYSTHVAPALTCGSAIYHHNDRNDRCPSGCRLAPLNYGAATTTAYECRPTAAATQVAALPIVAHLSCHSEHHGFTSTVTPQFGAKWTTCGGVKAGKTVQVPAVTVAVVTKKA
ncbi:hypothetical protein LTR53_006255 [Teratosphaeriaceae sp. CCFEE 6253]|nr:hypothetical protein LTR53_006255 [Teratosphaeriaceae sp. CCFEE 6253]